MNNKSNTFWAEFQILPNKQIKIKKANRLISLNQYSRKWVGTNARDLARVINKSELVTR